MSYSEIPRSSSYHTVHDSTELHSNILPNRTTSAGQSTLHRLRNGSEESSTPTFQEQPPSDADGYQNSLLAKTTNENEKPSTPPGTKRRAFRQWAIDLWFWEISLLFLSMAALGAQIGILWSYSGRSLPDWPSGLTLNALISLLSAVSTSALLSVISNIIGQNKWVWLSRDGSRLSHLELIDDASRGPWGSMIYLATARNMNAISFASIITICSLLTAPFVQQVVQIDYKTIATNYTSIQDRVIYHDSLGDIAGYYGEVPETLLSGFDQGLGFTRDLNDPLSRNYLQLTPNCPTGNCSFDVHDSLAVCSECADISSSLHLQQNYVLEKNRTSFTNYSTIDEHNNTVWITEPYTLPFADNMMNWTLPNGCYLQSDVSINETGLTGAPINLRTEGHCAPLKLKSDFIIANITAIVPCMDSQGVACPSKARAQECSLHWCVNRYRSQVIQGNLVEEVLASSNSGRLITLQGLGNEIDEVYYELSAPGSSLYPTNTTPYPSQWINGTTDRFVVGRYLSAGLTHFAADSLSGFTMQSLMRQHEFDIQFDSSRAISMFQKSTQGGKNFTMATVFQTIALGMTTALRSQNQPDGADFGLKTVTGKVLTLAPVLKIQWVWLSLPVALQVGALVLLLHSRFSRTRRVIPIWKSSAMAAVFFGGRAAPNLGDANVTKIVEMDGIASQVPTAGLFSETRG